MKSLRNTLYLLVPLVLAIVVAVARAEDLSPSALPSEVKEVLQERFPGIRISEASQEREDGVQIFEVKGVAGSQTIKVKITEAGAILEQKVNGAGSEDEGENEEEREGENEREDHLSPPITAGAPRTVTTTFVNFESPHGHSIDVSDDGKFVAACNTIEHRVELFEAGAVLRHLGSIPVGLDPVSVRFRGKNELWVVNHLSDSVSIVDLPARVIAETLQTDDEPVDIVFAGDPIKAYVTCSSVDKILVWDPENLPQVAAEIEIEGEDPRSLAVSPDGMTVYAAVFESGNRTTILGGGIGDDSLMSYPPNAVSDPDSPYAGQNPPPNRASEIIPAILGTTATPPRVGLIVRKGADGRWIDDNEHDWTRFVSGELSHRSGRVEGWDMIDNDVAVIETSTGEVSYVEGLMNLCMGIATNPASGGVFVVGSDATNEIRYEPNLSGTFVRMMGAIVEPDGPGDPAIKDLNPHLSYDVATVPQEERDRSIGEPRAVAFAADGSKAFVCGVGSNNVVVFDANGTRAGKSGTIEVGEGPSGIVCDAARDRLYVLNRFDPSVSVIDSESEKVVETVAFVDSTPEIIKVGRRAFMDTHRTSGLGQASCASCHVDGRLDRLAWDLGNPAGEGTQDTVSLLTNPKQTAVDQHPMKGPMTTQTLQDIIGKGPFHWRGDRRTIEDFNPTFEALLGDDEMLSDEDMLAFKTYLASLHFPPNPHRTMDNALPEDMPLPGHITTGRFGKAGEPLPNGNAQRGFDTLFKGRKHSKLGGHQCIDCHAQTSGLSTTRVMSIEGTRHVVHGLSDQVASTQPAFKIVQLRNLYDKVGFNATSKRSRSGFGYFHDGSVDSLERYVSEDMFEIESQQEVSDLVAFLLCFSGSDSTVTERRSWNSTLVTRTTSRETHAGVGVQRTTSIRTTKAACLEDCLKLTTIASRREIELIAHGLEQGRPTGWFYQADAMAARFPDRADLQRFVPAKAKGRQRSLQEFIDSEVPVTFTLVPRGSGRRLALDRDLDGLLDGDEGADLQPGVRGNNTPFDPNMVDVSGNLYSMKPDGIPDARNDFDGDRVQNSVEFSRGTNPADHWISPERFRLTIAGSESDSRIRLIWPCNPGEYQLQGSSNLKEWEDVGARRQTQARFVEMTAELPVETPFKYYRVVRKK